MGSPRTPGAQPVKWLAIDDLEFDPDIQRPTDEKRAEREIAAHFDPDKFGVIAVWLTEDGRYIVLDGMHRVTALRLMGWNGQKIPCSVFEGITKAQAAGIFIGRNSARAVRYIDRFLVRLVEQDAIACTINSIVLSAGYVIDRWSRDGTITAAKALEDVYLGRGLKVRGENPTVLRDTLRVVTNAWGRTRDAVSGQVVQGVGMMLLRYDDAVSRDRLTKKLAAVPGKDALAARGAGYRDMYGGSIATNIAHFLADEYNRGLRGKARLPGWREGAE